MKMFVSGSTLETQPSLSIAIARCQLGTGLTVGLMIALLLAAMPSRAQQDPVEAETTKLASDETASETSGESTGQDARDQQRSATEVIVVTAQKREQRLQDVPLSIDVLQGERLDTLRASAEDILYLSGRTPSLYAESSSGRIFPRFYIRGLGNTDFDLNSSQPVALVYDEVVLENPLLKGFPVFDTERVEVLRGPQGTSFGRNTPAGVIKFESARPTQELEGYGRLAFGRFDTVNGEGAVSGPVVDGILSARLSVLFQRRDDFIDNEFDEGGGEDGFGEFREFAGRLQLLFEPNDRFEALLNLHGRHLDGGSRLFRANVIEPGTNDLVNDFDRFEAAQDADQVLELYNFGTSLRTSYDFDGARIVSITAFETVGNEARGDVDGGFGADFAPPVGPGSIPFSAETQDDIQDHWQVTQELRAESTAWERLTLQGGVFLFFEDLEIANFNFDTLAGGIRNGVVTQKQETRAWALFANGSYDLTDRLVVAGGLRFSGEEKDFRVVRSVSPIGAGTLGPLDRDLGDLVWSGDASLTYTLIDGLDVFTRVARSFRAPAIQGRVLFGDAVTEATTERIWSYEGGFKATLPNGLGRINATGYYFETDDQQLTAIGGAGNFNQLLNADQVIGYGFELDIELHPVDRLDVTLGLSLNETEIQDEGLEVGVCAAPCTVRDPINPLTGNARIDGNSLPQAPRWIANGTLRYGVPVFSGRGELFGFLDVVYRSKVNFFLYQSEEFSDDRLVEVGVRVGYRDAADRYEFALFGRNITNDTSLEGAIDFNNLSGFVNEPPTWGIEATRRF